MIQIEIDTSEVRGAIRRAIETLEDMTPVYTDIGEYLLTAHRERFVKGVDPDGKPWAPKSAKTLERYKQRGYGSLGRPLIGPSKALSRQIVRFVSKDGVVIGSAQIYSGVMQDGAAEGAFGKTKRGQPIPFGTIPARRWLGLSAENEREIVNIVEEHLAADLGRD